MVNSNRCSLQPQTRKYTNVTSYHVIAFKTRSMRRTAQAERWRRGEQLVGIPSDPVGPMGFPLEWDMGMSME